MADINVIVLSGNVTSDIELKQTQSGVSVCSFGIAVRRPGTSNTTDFFDVVCWRNTAEFAAKYFRKGKRIEVTGILTQRQYEDRDGKKRTIVEVVAREVTFGERAEKKEEQTQNASAYGTATQPQFREVSQNDDLPF